ncbi:MAG TPA: hypothetical protein VN598_15510 [Usitatibacter sp.]|nr:hypothetical protein [Usitatibacter sp.]
MRKLAPTILFASITALAAGTALANTGIPSTDKVTGSPTVDANTNNPQGTSYSDKSNTSPGTNARMDDTARTGVEMDDHTKATTAKSRKHKAKLAKNVTPGTNPAPVDSSNGAAVNSTTGTSTGQ